MSNSGTPSLGNGVSLTLVQERQQTTDELVETARSSHGYAYVLFADRLLRGRNPQEPDYEWCRCARTWKANVGGPVPNDAWVTLLTEPQAEREMWPEFYTWADQWL